MSLRCINSVFQNIQKWKIKKNSPQEALWFSTVTLPPSKDIVSNPGLVSKVCVVVCVDIGFQWHQLFLFFTKCLSVLLRAWVIAWHGTIMS